MMPQLNFPAFKFRFSTEGQRKLIYDIIRRKYVVLTPEEWVRQHLIHYLLDYLHYPPGLLSVEKSLDLNGMLRRTDVVAYSRDARPLLVMECKAPDVQITQAVFDQVARYNMPLHSSFLLVSNGMQHFTCRINYANNDYVFLEQIPAYGELITS